MAAVAQVAVSRLNNRKLNSLRNVDKQREGASL